MCCDQSEGCIYTETETLCSLNRDYTKPLCGACVNGTVETSAANGACGVCPPESPLFFLAPACLGFLLVTKTLKGAMTAKQPIPDPMMAYILRSALFVFQLLPVLSFQSNNNIFAPIASLANFELDTSGGGDGEEEKAGTCYTDSLGPRQKLAIGLVPSIMFLGQWFIFTTIYFVKSRLKPSYGWTSEDTRKYDIAFEQAFWNLALALYAKAVMTVIKLSDCRPMGDPGEYCTYDDRPCKVMFQAGSIECYDNWHYLAGCLLLMLFLCPFGVIWILRREYLHPRHGGELGRGWKHLRRRYPALVMPYRRKRYWYSAWNLARRFVLILLVSIPTSRPDINATSLAVGMGLVLGMHVFARPFYHEINNKLETFSLFCGFCVSILNIMLDKPTFYNYATAFFALAPLIPIPFLMYKFIGQKSPITYAVVDAGIIFFLLFCGMAQWCHV